jgi:hypothetical protein
MYLAGPYLAAKQQFQQLTTDFRYNLKLLEVWNGRHCYHPPRHRRRHAL